MNNYSGVSTDLLTVFYIICVLLIGLFIWMYQRREKKDIGDKILIIFFWLSLIFLTFWFISSFSISLTKIFFNLSTVLLPIFWFAGALGIMIYGLYAVITRKTFVKSSFGATQVYGTDAIIMGLLWTCISFLIILGEFVVFIYPMLK